MFVGTRRSAQSEAKNLAKRVKKRLTSEDPERLAKLSELANNPLDNAVRTVVLQQGVSVSDHVNLIRDE